MISIAVIVALFGCALAAPLAAPPDTANCGKPAIKPSPGNSKVDGRIVGGKEAVPNSWPWQTQVLNNGGHYCGASLLSSDFILSAAHCFFRTSPTSFSFRFGRHSKSGANEPYQQISAAATVIVHEQYNPLTINNDVAVIRLATPVKYTDQVSPVCLPTKDTELASGVLVHITGWGSTEGTCCAPVLKQVEVPIIDRDTCNQRAYYNGAITQAMICAGLQQGGLDSCQGDSGGPLVAQNGDSWEQYGVVSWGSGCADAFKPGVYSNTVYLKDWIVSKVTQVEREEALISQKFRPVPSGSAFRELSREMVEKGELKMEDLPLGGAWMQ